MYGDEARRVLRRVENAVLQALRGPCAVLDKRAANAPPHLLVAVSGGPDSLALLHALARLSTSGRRPRASVYLTAAYIDHGLRPQQVTAEERDFVAAQAASLRLAFHTTRADVRAVARAQKRSIEDAARRVRYEALRELAHASGSDTVVTGHTMTDQAETVLLRVLRGAGVTGIGGMEWRAPWPVPGGGPALVRPLLGLHRADTELYCDALALRPRRDAENESPRYLRNRVRAELLPLLARYNPRIVERLADLAESARESRSLIASMLDQHWPSVAQVEPGRVAFAREGLASLPPVVQAEALRRAVMLLRGASEAPTANRLRAARALLTSGGGRVTELGGGIVAATDRSHLYVGYVESLPGRHTSALIGTWPLAREGTTRLPGWRVLTRPAQRPHRAGDEPYRAWLRADVVATGLIVTGRRPGDRIAPLGLQGEKKLQDLLVDAGVPRPARDAVPVLRAGDRIVWVVGVRLAAWAAAAPGDPAVEVRFEREVSAPSPPAERTRRTRQR